MEKVRVRKKRRRRSSWSPLYIRSVQLKNIRCFEDLKVGLTRGRKLQNWGVIFGDNGVGKTSFLRSIAMGLCDKDSAGGLLAEIYGRWNRTVEGKPQKAKIVIELQAKSGGPIKKITTTFSVDRSGIVTTDQDTVPEKNFPWDRIFLCGYGSARRAFTTSDFDEYAAVDAVYSLFNYDAPLQNPELVLRRLSRVTKGVSSRKGYERYREKTRNILDTVASILMLEEGSVALTKNSLEIKGPWGGFQPLGGIADGYQATLAWIADLLGWAYLYNEGRPLSRISGIVIVDEIEQHLHPRWQKKIIGLLSRQFPNIQFIVTTHTPMCAVGTTELEDDECELVVLQREADHVIAIENLRPPRFQWADQVLTSPLFGMAAAGDDEILEKTSRYNTLMIMDASKLTRAEKLEVSVLSRELTKIMSAPKSEFERTIEDSVLNALRRHSNIDVSAEAARFEVRRQLKKVRPQ